MSEEYEPMRASYSQDEMIQNARTFMVHRYGHLRGMSQDEKDGYHLKLGVLVDFITENFPSENK